MKNIVIGRREDLTIELVRALQPSRIRFVQVGEDDSVVITVKSSEPAIRYSRNVNPEPIRALEFRRTNVLGMELVAVPDGIAIGPKGEVALIEQMWVADSCITNEQWDAFAASSHYDGTGDCADTALYAAYHGSYRGAAHDSRFSQPAMPAVCLSWKNAVNIAMWLTRVERERGRLGGELEYRLPTEVEWEYACGASRTSRFSYGDEADHAFMNFAEAPGAPTEKGTFPSNPWGLYDMHGNVFEWCENLAGASDLHSRSNIHEEGYRANRGGSWASAAESCSTFYRHWNAADSCHDRLGARLVLAQVSR